MRARPIRQATYAIAATVTACTNTFPTREPHAAVPLNAEIGAMQEVRRRSRVVPSEAAVRADERDVGAPNVTHAQVHERDVADGHGLASGACDHRDQERHERDQRRVRSTIT